MNETTLTVFGIVAVIWSIYLLLSVVAIWRLGFLWGAGLVGGATWFLAPYLRMTVAFASFALLAERLDAPQNLTGV